MKTLTILLFVYSSIAFTKVKDGPDMEFRLTDHQGVSQSIGQYTDYDLVGLIALNPKCQNQSPDEKKIGIGKKIKWLFVYTGEKVSRDELLKNAAITMPVLMDRTEVISRSFELKNNGDYLLINPKNYKVTLTGKVDKRSACPINYSPVVKKFSFESEIFPVLKSACMNCHINIGNLNIFDNIKSIRSWTPMNLRTIRLGKMPGTPDTEYVPVKEEVKAADLKKLIHWMEAGAPIEKKQEDLIPAYHAEVKKNEQDLLESMGKPDLILEAEADESISPEQNDYIKVYKFPKLNVKEDQYLKKVYLSTNLNVAHHHQLTGSKGKSNEEESSDGFSYRYANPLPVETYINGSKSKGFLYNYKSVLGVLRNKGFVWTGTPYAFPIIEKDSYLNLTVHYVASGRAETNRPKLLLYFAKDTKEISPLYKTLFMPAKGAFKLSAGLKNYNVTIKHTLTEPIRIIKYIMHAHYRATSGKILVKRPEDKEFFTLFSLPYYQFKMPSEASLQDPMLLPTGTQIISEMIFDNSKENTANPDHTKNISIGLDSQSHEMSFSQIIYTKEEGKE